MGILKKDIVDIVVVDILEVEDTLVVYILVVVDRMNIPADKTY
jgi:hypothetical protein